MEFIVKFLLIIFIAVVGGLPCLYMAISMPAVRKRLIFRYDRKNPRLLFSSRSTLTIHI